MSAIPIIDISPWTRPDADEEERLEVARAWDAAFSASGFAIVVSHGISTDVFERMDREARQFFERDAETKMEHNHGPYGNPKGGYTPPGVEAVGRSKGEEGAKADPVENFAFRGPPADYQGKDGQPSTPFPYAQQYVNQMESLLATFHRITAAAFGLPAEFFNEKFRGSMGANGNALRLAYYPSPANLSDRADLGEKRYGEHTDYQTFTILRPDPNDWTGNRGGLEVFLEPTQEWVPVVLPKGRDALVVNAGDLWELWTNERWHSGLHRVTGAGVSLPGSQPSADEPVPARLSLVYFSGPDDGALIEPISGIGKGTRKAVTSGDHLRQKLGITNV